MSLLHLQLVNSNWPYLFYTRDIFLFFIYLKQTKQSKRLQQFFIGDCSQSSLHQRILSRHLQFSVVAQQEFPKSKKDWGGGVRWAMGIKVHVPNSYPLVFFFRPSYTTCLPALYDGNHSSKMSLCCVSKKVTQIWGVGYTLSSSMKMIGQWSHTASFFCSLSL